MSRCVSALVNNTCTSECVGAYILPDCSKDLMAESFPFMIMTYVYTFLFTTVSFCITFGGIVGLVHFLFVDKRGQSWSSMQVTAVYICLIISCFFRGLHSLDVFGYYYVYPQVFLWLCFWMAQNFYYTALVFMIAAWYVRWWCAVKFERLKWHVYFNVDFVFDWVVMFGWL